eukprot:PhF_6_TR8032/c0_g1_i1/m.12450
MTGIIEVPHELRSRLLYTNPVCILTTWDPETSTVNAMTISWITPLSNRATFIASMNAHRFSAGLVKKTKTFVLSVPTKGDEELVLSIGGCSGKDGNKIEKLNVPLVSVGWSGPWVPDPASPVPPAVAGGCCAHIVCDVMDPIQEADGHLVLTCKMSRAFVKGEYWTGKQFIPIKGSGPTDDDVTGPPPYLTFLGNATFAYVR